MISAVLGFMFCPMKGHVVLLKKKRPDDQRGKFNGVGGKVEDGESAPAAMVREFMEETGVETKQEDWELVVLLKNDAWHVSVYRTFSDSVYAARSMSDENVAIVDVEYLFEFPTMRNTRWLVPFCLDDSPYDLPLVIAESGDGSGKKAIPKIENPLPRNCNMHGDCDAADARAREKDPAASVEHCHDECCEDCFGC